MNKTWKERVINGELIEVKSFICFRIINSIANILYVEGKI